MNGYERMLRTEIQPETDFKHTQKQSNQIKHLKQHDGADTKPQTSKTEICESEFESRRANKEIDNFSMD